MAHTRIAIAAAFFILLASPAFALNITTPALLDFAAQAVPADQGFSIAEFPYAGTTGFAVVSNDEVYAIFASGIPLLENQPLTDIHNIEGALADYYLSQGHSPNLTFSDVHAGIASVSDDYEKGEDKCRILTGTDRTECIDFDTCQKACYSVTSFCRPIALGVGRAFINEIWAFENNSILLGTVYLNESVAHAALLDGITQEEAAAYLDSLVAINRAATQASNSALYDAYSYCFEPDYALPVITNMQLYAQKAYAKAKPFFTLAQSAQLVRQRTLDALERKVAPAPAGAPEANSTAEPALQNTAEPGNATLPPSQPEPPAEGISDLVAMAGAAALVAIFIAGILHLAFFSKKKKKGL